MNTVMLFENIGKAIINCEPKSLHNSFENLYWKPNHLNKLIHGCINEKDLWNRKEEDDRACIECLIADVVGNEVISKTKMSPVEKSDVACKRLKVEDNGDDDLSFVFESCKYCMNEKKYLFGGKLKNMMKNFFLDSNFSANIRCHIRKLIPKHTKKFLPIYECLMQETTDSYIRLLVIPICLVSDNILLTHKSYGFVFKGDGKTLYAYIHKDFHLEAPASSLVASKDWMTGSVLPKLKKWGESTRSHHSYQFESLINMEKYSCLYFQLKEKYAPYFISIWPENTDPLKFVYEDIGIATYLLLIWDEDRSRKNLSSKQSFIDLGCGNGLLVYILVKEGHPGKGIDIMKRKIWDIYGDGIVLEESSILPHTLKVDVDWIIGNHTDELTPWIPIIAARSSYFVNYFVLPCCFYDFNKKFDSGAASCQSKYRNYLDYIVKIGEDCGFKVEEDILKIPSTKRICSIGRERLFEKSEHKNIDSVIGKILKSNSCFVVLDDLEQDEGFSPREVTKDPKNCTQIDPHVKERIIDAVIKRLFEKTNMSYDGDDDKLTSSGHKWSEWNAGDSIPLSECATLFNKELLKNLKDQSGGLQSLLRNHQRIFKVYNGMVALRDFRKSDELRWGRKRTTTNEISNIKTIGCWFYISHPQGCVLSSEDCRYAHGEEDRRFFHDEK